MCVQMKYLQIPAINMQIDFWKKMLAHFGFSERDDLRHK